MLFIPSVFSVVFLCFALIASAPAAARAAKPDVSTPAVEASPGPQVPPDEWGKPEWADAIAHYAELHALRTEVKDLRREVAGLREEQAACGCGK